MKLYLAGKKKLGYVTETIVEPPHTDPSVGEWEAEHPLVMYRLLNSMEPTVSDGLLFANTAKEIWDSVVETYSEQNNIAIVYELKQASSTGCKILLQSTTLPVERT